MSHPTDRLDRALSTRTTLLTTYNMALDCVRRGIPGDFVECGVFAGAQCAAMALAILHGYGAQPTLGAHIDRRVHLFDSFEGIPAGGEYDLDWKAGGLKPGESACALDRVKLNMQEWGIPEELLVYHPGWFSEAIPNALGSNLIDGFGNRGIAMLRLDGDLYESTKPCLELLYPLLSPGGWLIVDDFGLDGCRKAVLEYFAPSAPWPLYCQKP